MSSDSDSDAGAGCLILLAGALVLAILYWLYQHAGQIGAGLAFLPLFATALALDPPYVLQMLGHLTLDGYLAAALRYASIGTVLISVLIMLASWPRLSIGVVSLAVGGAVIAIFYGVGIHLYNLAAISSGWMAAGLWVSIVLTVIAGIGGTLWAVHPTASLICDLVERIANLLGAHAPFFSRPWWLVVLALPWATLFRSSLVPPGTSNLPSFWLLGSVLAVLGATSLWLKRRRFPLSASVLPALRSQFQLILRWLPVLRGSDDLGWRLAALAAIGAGYFALRFLPTPDWAGIASEVLTGRFSLSWQEWLVSGVFLAGAALSLAFPIRFLRLALRVSEVVVAVSIWHAWANALSATSALGLWMALLPAMALTGLSFLAVREVALVGIVIDEALVKCRSFSTFLAPISLAAYWFGGHGLANGDSRNWEKPTAAAAIALLCLAIGLLAMVVNPSSTRVTGQPFSTPLIIWVRQFCLFLTEPLRRMAEEKRRVKEAERRQREAEAKAREMERQRQAREAARMEEERRRAEEARIAYEALLKSGRIREKCSEVLMLKCAHCGSESLLPKWAEEGDVCPDCGEPETPTRGTCQRCKQSCEGSAGERNCHSIDIYRKTGKIVF